MAGRSRPRRYKALIGAFTAVACLALLSQWNAAPPVQSTSVGTAFLTARSTGKQRAQGQVVREVAGMQRITGITRHNSIKLSPLEPLPATLQPKRLLDVLQTSLKSQTSVIPKEQASMVEVQLPSPKAEIGTKSKNEQKCIELHSAHHVQPGQSWGSLSVLQIDEWIARKCDLFFCEPTPLSGQNTFTCVPLTERQINGLSRLQPVAPTPTTTDVTDVPVLMESKSVDSKIDFDCDFDELEGSGCQMRCSDYECTNAVTMCVQTSKCQSIMMNGRTGSSFADHWATLKAGKGNVVFDSGAFSFIRPSLLRSTPYRKGVPTGNSLESGQMLKYALPKQSGQMDLIHLHGQTVKYLESRIEAGQPAVHEHFPSLQWSNSNWKEMGEDRSHFRSHFPLYTLQTLWDHVDHIYQELGVPGFPAKFDVDAVSQMKDGEVVFVNQCWKKFLNTVAPKLHAKVTLVLFDGDSRFCDSPEAKRLKQVANVVRIYATNACPHPKVVPLPLGIEDNFEFPTSFATWTFHGSELKLAKFMHKLTQTPQVKEGVFCDMSVSTNPDKRKPAVAFCELLQKNPKPGLSVNMGSLATNQGKKTWQAYLTTLARHRFVVSPEGNGWDCHRTWEALLLGTIPIVHHDDGVSEVYEGLPIVFVKSWSEITQARLEAEWNKFVSAPRGTYTYEKLFAPYWIDKIRGIP